MVKVKRRNAVVVAMTLAMMVAAGAAACGFPDVMFAEVVDPSTEGGADVTSDAPGDTNVNADTSKPIKPDVDPDGGSQDATKLGEAAVPIDAAGCVTCDCDLDGYNRIELAKGCDGGGNGKKADCDDLNKAIHPDVVGFILDQWPASQHLIVGDWDCNGQALHQYDYNANCAALSPCTGGFVGEPPCGGFADYITCKDPVPLLGLTCSEKTRESASTGLRPQGCR
jgi:hypothetical protein